MTASRDRWARRFFFISWGGAALGLLVLFIHYLLHAYHAWGEAFILFARIGILAGLFGFLRGLLFAILGPRRRSRFQVGFLSLLPVILWGLLAAYLILNQNRRYVPYNFVHLLGRFMGLGTMELHARYGYPHRIESERLVMFYDDRISDPQGDLKLLDDHLRDLEERTGRRLRGKPWLVRGRTLGFGSVCGHGLAMGSDRSPAGSLDRHELGHAFINSILGVRIDPPFLLVEGWAMWVEETPNRAIHWYRNAQDYRMGLRLQFAAEKRPDDSILKELVNAQNYHIDAGAVYYVGPLLVDQLIRKHGMEKFLDLYQRSTKGNFLTLFRELYGVEFESLEADFWRELDEQFQKE
jgi:hypothetical protein